MNNFQENQKAINYIIKSIKSGVLKRGDKLPSERDLTDAVGISRSSTREAISILRGMGLVESRHGSGNYIVNNTEASIKQMVEIMLSLGNITQKEVIDYRRIVSKSVGTLLIENSLGIPAEYEKKIIEILAKMQGATDEEFRVLDRDFHLSLIKSTNNTLFITVMEPIGELYLDLIEDVIMASTDIDREKRVSMHMNIFQSIQDRDMDACDRYMKEHYDYVESKIK